VVRGGESDSAGQTAREHRPGDPRDPAGGGAEAADSRREQLDYALALVGSGRVARECGVQRELIDLLCDAGADPAGVLVPALAHREVAAAERLLERGAALTLLAAVGTGRAAEVTRLAQR
jgi:hypothetical protein